MIREFFEAFTIPLLVIFGFLASILFGLTVLSSNTMKYNCNLEYGPSLKTTFLISSDDFGYDPKGFCARLKAKMEQE